MRRIQRIRGRAGSIAALIVVLGVAARAAAQGAAMLESVGTMPRPSGLADGTDVAVSADGTFVYAVGEVVGDVDGVAVYERDLVGDDFVVVQVIRDDTAGVTHLFGPREIVLSPGGEHVYVTSGFQDAVTVFSRDAGTGLLTFVETKTDAGAIGLDGADGLVISSDGAYVYVGGAGADKIVVFARDGVTGALTFVEAQSHDSAGKLALSPDGAHLYSVSSFDSVRGVFARDAVAGTLTQVQSVGMDDPTDVAVSPDGLHVYIANQSPPQILRHTRNAGTGALTLDETIPLSVNGFPFHVSVSADGASVLLGTRSNPGHALQVFDRDETTGALTFVDEEEIEANGAAISPDGAQVFAAGEGVSVLDRDTGTGELAFVGRHVARTPRYGAFSPDGAHLYATVDRLLAVYSRDAVSGLVTLDAVLLDGFAGADGLGGAKGVAASPDGAHLYVALSQFETLAPGFSPPHDDGVSVFERDPGTGEVTLVQTLLEGGPVSGLAGATAIAVSSDGAHVYVGSTESGAVVSLERDALTGELTFIEADFDLDADDDRWMALSPDGGHLYGHRDAGQTLVIHERDAVTGALSLAGTMPFATELLTGTVSPDSAQVYLVRSFPLTLAAYARDAVTGALTLIDEEENGAEGVVMATPHRVHASPDGAHVYTASSAGSLSSFARDRFEGDLAFVEDLPVSPFVPNSVAFPSPDSAHLYLPALEEILARGHGCAAVPLAGCRPAEKGKVVVVDDETAKKDRFKWSWIQGLPTSHAEFDPGSDNHYAACVYETVGGNETLLVSGLVPAGQDCTLVGKPCWLDAIKQFIYKDPRGTPEGVSQVLLRPSDSKPQIKVKAGGEHVGWLAATPLPVSLPARVQLQAESGLCWEATYSVAKKNDGKTFKAVAD